MSIAAANLFTRSIYREYLRPGASAAEEIRIGKWASLLVKAGAVLAILLLDPQFSIDLQLIGGVVILQILPAVVIGLYSRWPHRGALLAGLASGLAVGMFMLYQVQQIGPDGRVLRAHFGGPSWPLANLGLDTRHTVYVGVVAVLVNLAVTMLGTLVLRGFRIPAGTDRTRPVDYLADEDGAIERMTELVDGIRMRRPAHLG
jgi:SSS family solute:Na+ symporter